MQSNTAVISVHASLRNYHEILRALRLLGYHNTTESTPFDAKYPYVLINTDTKFVTPRSALPGKCEVSNLVELLTVINGNAKFEAGDWVVRLDSHDKFTIDEAYEVREMEGADVCFERQIQGWWFARNFAKVDKNAYAIETAVAKKQKELENLQKQMCDLLLNRARTDGFVVGAKVCKATPGWYIIDDLSVCTGDNYKSYSIRVRQQWEDFKKPFVVVHCHSADDSGKYTIPIFDISLVKNTPPVIHGYTMGPYLKGDTFVVFGCANIDIELLKAVRKNNRMVDRRKVQTITLYSGKTITNDDVEHILNYIGE